MSFSTYHVCQAFNDIKAKIYTDNDILHISIEDKHECSDVRISLNPAQAIAIGVILQKAGKEQLNKINIDNHFFFGGIAVEIDNN